MSRKKVVKPRVPRTRNDNTMTEAQFWGWIRSQLRRMSMRWRPIYGILKDNRRAVTPEDKAKWGNRIRWVFQCSICRKWFPQKQIEVDHIIPCGSLRSYSDVGVFLERLLCERSGLRLACGECHSKVTEEQRGK